ncbi:hypothetical protein SAMN02982929_05590 [Saccharopolyspora kobensis]|uniref:Uncharacterized protein n=1 Tax=Saccharopolyspora kobensis TaxID=146035 RepID=A0A1H6E6C9_9PSEU|nr:hypothetical protein [Saccharopolyspora kobensis]SEG92514.1 hypothetical protein SAMN02982929_05590 [Saccharopolyspora kobensis]SFD38677.1 hypothetical protein SAMN05216506_104119 [Saccharopolyspora kobensis]
MAPARPAVLTPLVAVAATVVGVLVLFFGQSALSLTLVEALCPAPDCALGIGLWLMAGAVLAPLISLIAGLLLRRSDRPVGRGLHIALWCVAAYLAESVVLWIIV